MSSVRIIVSRGDGLVVEYDYDNGIIDRAGGPTRDLLDTAVAAVRASLRGSEPPTTMAANSGQGA